MELTSKKITEIDLEFVKEYLKVDYPDEDTIISAIILGAKSYIENVLGYKITEEYPITQDIPDEFTIVALMLIAHWFDMRQIQTSGYLGDEMSFAVSAILDAHKNHFKGVNYEFLYEE